MKIDYILKFSNDMRKIISDYFFSIIFFNTRSPFLRFVNKN